LPELAAEADLPADTKIWVLASGKIGHEVNCFGIVRALGVEPVVKNVRPRALFERLAPYGPIDPRDASGRAGSLLAPPFPDIVIASGRATVPYLRHLKRASKGRVFAAFMQDPRWHREAFDLIWVPEHDALRAPNVLATLTSPHHLRPAALQAARRVPDARILALKGPRLAMVLGGTSAVHRFETADAEALAAIARQAVESGFGLMVTPSRRTPPEVIATIRDALADMPEGRAFVWDGSGDNPYVQMLAHADRIVVTGDSVNMIGEAAATGMPVHVYEPSGGGAKMTRFIDRMVETGAVRRWAGGFDRWSYEPVDATALIARTLAERFARFGGRV
jgi:mitochondrial fission protein ELM1